MGFMQNLFGGGGGPSKAPQFNPDVKQFTSDIGRIRKVGQTAPTELRQSANIQLNQLSEDKKQLLSQLASRGQGQLSSSLDGIASQGGLSGGASERLAKQANRDTLFGQQRVGSDVARLKSDVRSNDFSEQEALKNRALFATPELEAKRSSILNQAGAANLNARSIFAENKRASKNSALKSIFTIGGGIIGGVAGGPAGASLGASLGGTVSEL